MGKDKAWLVHQGRTLLQLQLERLESIGCKTHICGAAGRDYEKAGRPLIEDLFQDAGPMGGIHAGLSSSRADLVVVLAVDLPYVDPGFLLWMVQSMGNEAVRCPTSENGREPLCAIFRPRECLKSIEEALQRKDYSLQKWLDGMAREVKVSEVLPQEWRRWGNDLFDNWNAPTDVKP